MINTSHKKGILSELLASVYYTREGYGVSKPISGHERYDFIIDNEGKLSRIQVKTIFFLNRSKRYIISCATSHTGGNKSNEKYKKNSFEFLVGVEIETGAIYEIPLKAMLGRRSIIVYPTGKPNTTMQKVAGKRYPDFEKFRVH